MVLLNNGNGTFTDSGLLLPDSKVYAWADYNRDGKTDCVHVDGKGYATLSRKGGSGMETVGFPITILAEAFAWGDVDNDGWLDLAVCGYNETYTKVGYILRNNNGTLEQYASIPCVVGGGFDWCDFDNDGRADLCAWGDYGDGWVGSDRNIRTKIYRNNGGGSFTSMGFNLWDVGGLMGNCVDFVRFFDIDRDGDLDMTICGPGRPPYPQPRKFYIYENATAQKGGLNRPNTPPSVPYNLIASQSTQNGPITFTWNSSSDAQTPQGGLTYDVIVGTNPGWGNILPPDASMPLEGRHGRPSLSSSQLGMRLDKPPSKAFYWSARAVDPAQGVSAWATPHLFVPKGAATPGDVNADGKVNIADLIQTAQMGSGQRAVNVSKADRNGDGGVDSVDNEIMSAMLLGSTGPDARTLAAKSIDTAGGTITTTGIAVGVPKGAFGSANTLKIEKVRGPDAANGRISNTYRISGIPTDFTKPLTFRIHATQSSSSKVYGSLGEISYHMSAGMLAPGVRKTAATAAGGGDYVFTLPPASSGIKLANTPKPAAAAPATPGYTLTIDIDLDNHVSVWANSHFSISFDSSKVDLKHIIPLGTALEDAYQKLKSAAGGTFDYSARTSWPVCVNVCKLDSLDKYGEYMCSKLGVNHGWMEFNTDNITDHAEMRVTAMHEFFHMVQEFYDPRNFASRAVLQPEQLWLNDASSVWSEALIAPAGYVSPMEKTYVLAPFNGLLAGAQGSSKNAQNHGYGMASLIQWLVKRSNATVVLNIYKSIKAGSTSAAAVKSNGPTKTDFSWWPDYLLALIKGEILAFGSADIANAAPAERQFMIAAATDIEKNKVFAEAIPDLSGRLHMAIPNYSGLTDKHRLAIRLARDEGDNFKLRVLKSKATETTMHLGDGVAANGAWKYEITGLNALQAAGGYRLLPLVTNKKSTNPKEGKSSYELKVAVVGEGSKAFTPRTIKGTAYYGAAFPTLSFEGSLQGRGWSDWTTLDIGYFNYYVIDVPALTPIDYKVSATATLTGATVKLPAEAGGYYETLSVDSIKHYKFEYWPDDFQAQPSVMTSTTGTFNFTLLRDSKQCGGSIYAVYNVVRKRFDKDDRLLSQSTDPDQETGLVGFAMMP